MTAIQNTAGKWIVVNGSETLAGPFDTMAEAWRWIDRNTGQPVSCSEKTGEWLWNNRVHGE